MIQTFVDRMIREIAAGLPGVEAQRMMAPPGRKITEIIETDFPDAKKGSVLILFYPVDEEIFTVLIQRPGYEGVHGGQVSFPGGKVEESDHNTSITALRETEEEIGVSRDSVQLFARLSNIYIPPSNFLVFPYLGFCTFHPEFSPDKNEVEFIIEMPVNILTDESIKGNTEIIRSGNSISTPCYNILGNVVWGATAIMLSELEWLIKKVAG